MICYFWNLLAEKLSFPRWYPSINGETFPWSKFALRKFWLGLRTKLSYVIWVKGLLIGLSILGCFKGANWDIFDFCFDCWIDSTLGEFSIEKDPYYAILDKANGKFYSNYLALYY